MLNRLLTSLIQLALMSINVWTFWLIWHYRDDL